MHYSGIPEKPLFAAVNTKMDILKKEKVYFFKREDGSVFYTGAQEAWSLCNRRNQVIGKIPQRIELVGTGDGEIFLNALKEAQKEPDILKAQDIIRKGQEAEYEACKGKVIMPPDFDKQGDGSKFV